MDQFSTKTRSQFAYEEIKNILKKYDLGLHWDEGAGIVFIDNANNNKNEEIAISSDLGYVGVWGIDDIIDKDLLNFPSE